MNLISLAKESIQDPEANNHEVALDHFYKALSKANNGDEAGAVEELRTSIFSAVGLFHKNYLKSHDIDNLTDDVCEDSELPETDYALGGMTDQEWKEVVDSYTPSRGVTLPESFETWEEYEQYIETCWL
jgi:hypothetical protein